jgi:hypothetical protein
MGTDGGKDEGGRMKDGWCGGFCPGLADGNGCPLWVGESPCGRENGEIKAKIDVVDLSPRLVFNHTSRIKQYVLLSVCSMFFLYIFVLQ